jgi:hypothetical protein
MVIFAKKTHWPHSRSTNIIFPFVFIHNLINWLLFILTNIYFFSSGGIKFSDLSEEEGEYQTL